AFGLDHQEIVHWRRLLTHLAGIHFARRKPGASKAWNSIRLCQLMVDVAERKATRPKAKDADICRWLIKNTSGKDYKNLSDRTLRRKLQDARNPACNAHLFAAIEAMMRTRQGNDQSEADDKSARVECLQWLVDNPDLVWGSRRLGFLPPYPTPK